MRITAPGDQPIPPYLEGNPRILVIDDEQGMRDMLAFELKQEGFEVSTVGTGQDAVDLVQKQKFDLAITDLKMPGMDGMETLEALKSIDPEIEVIVATGYATVGTAIASMKLGAYDYIQKPFDLSELLLLLERALQKRYLQEVVALYEASRILLRTLHQPELVRLGLELAPRLMGASAACLILDTKGCARPVIHRGEEADSPSDVFLLDLTRQVKQTEKPLHYPVRGESPPVPDMETGQYPSGQVFPLFARSRPNGALVVLRNQEQVPYTGSELKKGIVFASQLSASLDNARLYKELEDKIHELVTTRERLVQAEKLALAGKFSETILHEINNPLSFIQSNLGVLHDFSREGQLEEPMATEMAEAISESIEGTRRIAELVAGLGHLAKPPVNEKMQNVDVGQVIAHWFQGLASRTGAGEIKVTMETEGIAHSFPIAPAGLMTALSHILSFLRRSRKNGRREEKSDFSVQVNGTEDCLSVEIRDPHLELTTEQRLDIFDPRIDIDSDEGRTLRMDVGLAIAHQILAHQGAELSVESDQSGGTIFRLAYRPREEGNRESTTGS